MANRYWVGGTATWDATAGSKWAATSGGAGGQTVPTSSDDVFFDANSTGTCTTSGTTVCNCNNLTMTGHTGTLTVASSGFINVYGNLTLATGGTINFGNTASTFQMLATTTGKTVTSNGKAHNIWFNGVGGEWALQDAYATASGGSISITNGSFISNNQNITINGTGRISSNTANTRSINLGTSTVALGNTGIVDIQNVANLTLSAASCAITSTASSGAVNITATNQTFGSLSITSLTSGSFTIGTPGSGGTITFTGNVTMSCGANSTSSYQLGENLTVGGTLTMNGNSVTNRCYLRSTNNTGIGVGTVGTPVTVTAAAVSFSNIDFRDIAAAGTANWNLSSITGGSGDCGGNSGITFTSAANQYWVPSAGTSTGSVNVITRWASSSGGTAGTGRIPLPQDTMIFDANSIDAGSRTITFNLPRMGSVNASTVTNNPTLACSTITSVHGDYIMGTYTRSGNVVYTFEGRGSNTLNPAGVIWNNGITVLNEGGSLNLAGDINTTSNFIISSGNWNSGGHTVACSSATLNAAEGTINNLTATTTFNVSSASIPDTTKIMNIAGTVAIGTNLVIAGNASRLAITGDINVTGAITFPTTGVANILYDGGSLNNVTQGQVYEGNGGGLSANPMKGFIA